MKLDSIKPQAFLNFLSPGGTREQTEGAGSLYALTMINSLPPVHFEGYKAFLCVHLCALCYASGVSLWAGVSISARAHQCLRFWCHQRGVLLAGVEKDRRGTVGPLRLTCCYLRVQRIKGCMDARGLRERGIDLLFGEQRSGERHRLLVGSSCRVSRKLKVSRKPYGMGC